MQPVLIDAADVSELDRAAVVAGAADRRIRFDRADCERSDRAAHRQDRAHPRARVHSRAACRRFRRGCRFSRRAGVVAAAQEVLIGIAIGMVVQLAFEALSFAGQSISTTMGLGFATLVDPQHGANTPVLGQLFVIFGTLTYLAVNGHLRAARRPGEQLSEPCRSAARTSTEISCWRSPPGARGSSKRDCWSHCRPSSRWSS